MRRRDPQPAPAQLAIKVGDAIVVTQDDGSPVFARCRTAPPALRCSFTVVSDTADQVVIRDMDVGCTVTNDAEAVVAYLHAHRGLGRRRLLYYDSDGRLDQLLHDGAGTFTGYGPVQS